MTIRLAVLVISSIAALLSPSASAAVLWEEAIDGELSGDIAGPTAAGSVAPGTHSILGSIGPGDVVDAVSFVVPADNVLTSFVVLSFPPGDLFSSAPFALRRGPGDFSEVIEFGNYASASPPGFDLLKVSSAPGPQGPGAYALSVGHPALGAIPETRSYVVEFTTAVPEPTSVALLLCGAALLWLVSGGPRRARG